MPFNTNSAVPDYAAPYNKPARHLVGIGLVVGLHVLILVAINSGLARAVVNTINPPVEAILLKENKPEPVVPPKLLPPPVNKLPAPAPLLVKVPAYVPAFVPVAPAPAAPPAANALVAVTSKPGPELPAAAPGPAVQPAPVRTAAGVSTAHCEKPEYPAISRRREEKGTVTLRFLVSVQGRVLQSEVESSSGYTRLDEAARNGLSKCLFRPATVDGRAEQAWASMKYTWQLD